MHLSLPMASSGASSMDWSDLEYLLQKTYISGRSHSACLINRENALNLSYNGALSKTSIDSLKFNRKIVQLTSEIYNSTDRDDEKLVLADLIEHYSEEFILSLAKKLKYHSVMGTKTSGAPSNFSKSQFAQGFINCINDDLSRLLSPKQQEENDAAVCAADSAFAAIYDILNHKTPSECKDEDLIDLTQSINNAIIGHGNDMEVSAVDTDEGKAQSNPFMTAKQALIKNIGNNRNNSNSSSSSSSGYNPSMQARKLLGAKRRFVDPKNNGNDASNSNYRDEGRDINTEFSYYNMNKAPAQASPSTNKQINNNQKAPAATPTPEEPVDERLAGIEPRLIEMIRNEIMHRVDNITWESIAGLEHAKNSIKEIVVWPMLRPDIFKGLRGPPKGLLLFGPPGTGKTMIGKCIASQAKATFFSISASSLTSKWVGEGEKMVRALFAVARCSQPAVIFIDEIDSLLTQRTDGEFEASRRIKTEFLVQFDGAGTNSEDRILVIGATNRPQEIDEAARRRLLKRLYIPLPESGARSTIIKNLLSNQAHSLSDEDIDFICSKTEGYSGSDMDGLCREAAIGPIRSISDILNISTNDVRPISRLDFEEALNQVRASVSNQDLELYLDWNQKFGSLNVNKPPQ